MASLEVNGDQLEVRLSPWEKLGAFHGSIRVPLSRVSGVETTDQPLRSLRGIRAPGTGIPGVIALGTWRSGGGRDFVAVYRRRPAVIVRIRDSRFDRLVISVDEPEEFAAQLTRRLAATGG